MKNKKIIYLSSIVLILLVLPLSIFSSTKAIDENAVSREKNSGYKYISDDSIPLTDNINTAKQSTKSFKEAQKALSLVNEIRKENNLKEFTWDINLETAATVRAKEIQEKWSHTRPNGQEWWTVNENIMYGENLAKGYKTAEEVVQAWYNSEDHKANLLDKELETCAISIYIDKLGKWYWAQEFGYN